MPYNSPKDVPNHVPKDHKKQWLEVWNSIFDKSGDESSAFTQANGVIKKAKKKDNEAERFTDISLGAGMFYKVKEEGKRHSADDMKMIQNIHDTTASLGGSCDGTLAGGGIYESARCLEAALPHNTSHGDLHWKHMPNALKGHLGVKDTWDEQGPYVDAVFPEHVVYSHKGAQYRQKYSIKHGAAGSDPEIKFHGDKKKVHTAYVDSADQDKEAMRVLITPKDGLVEDRTKYDKLVESGSVTVTHDGSTLVRESVSFSPVLMSKESGGLKRIPVKIIKEGWGSMAYYPKDVLVSDGPEVFCKGTKMFWNHSTESQSLERPEGDINDLAAILTKDAFWDEKGAEGPGLYSEAKVFSDYADQVDEKGGHIGLSINTYVKVKEGEIAGRSGRIAEKLLKTNMTSVDFVATAGAGGRPIVPVRESGRSPEKEMTMTEQEKAELDALKIENAKLKEGQNLVLAVATVGSVLTEAGVKFSQKLLEKACATPTMKDGKLDADWVKETAKLFMDGTTTGVEGMGHTREAGRRSTETKITEAETKEFSDIYKDLGVPEAGLKYALRGGN